eukprot:5911246-Pleurochrysis_carterae.AAC.1
MKQRSRRTASQKSTLRAFEEGIRLREKFEAVLAAGDKPFEAGMHVLCRGQQGKIDSINSTGGCSVVFGVQGSEKAGVEYMLFGYAGGGARMQRLLHLLLPPERVSNRKILDAEVQQVQ